MQQLEPVSLTLLSARCRMLAPLVQLLTWEITDAAGTNCYDRIKQGVATLQGPLSRTPAGRLQLAQALK